MNAGTVPTLASVPCTVGISALAPKMGNTSVTNATTPADTTAAATTYAFAATTGAVWPYAYVVAA